eukprot:scaffold12001_cov116-Isochrysis_galbana.AAC.13
MSRADPSHSWPSNRAAARSRSCGRPERSASVQTSRPPIVVTAPVVPHRCRGFGGTIFRGRSEGRVDRLCTRALVLAVLTVAAPRTASAADHATLFHGAARVLAVGGQRGRIQVAPVEPSPQVAYGVHVARAQLRERSIEKPCSGAAHHA